MAAPPYGGLGGPPYADAGWGAGMHTPHVPMPGHQQFHHTPMQQRFDGSFGGTPSGIDASGYGGLGPQQRPGGYAPSPYQTNGHAQPQFMPNLLHPSPSQRGQHSSGGYPSSSLARERTSPNVPRAPLSRLSAQHSSPKDPKASQKLNKQPLARHRPRDVGAEPPPPIGGLFDQQFVASPAPHSQGFAPMDQSPAGTGLRPAFTTPAAAHGAVGDFAPGTPYQQQHNSASASVFGRSISTPAPAGEALFGRSSTHVPSSPSHTPGPGQASPHRQADLGAASFSVTVFGFAPDDASFVLSEFEQYGTIVRKKIEPGANWMHLTYDTKMQAEKALSKNGHTFAGKIMVGVRACADPDFSKPEALADRHRGILGTPTPRKLTRSKQGATSMAATPTSAKTPSRSGSYMSTLTDYLFGW